MDGHEKSANHEYLSVDSADPMTLKARTKEIELWELSVDVAAKIAVSGERSCFQCYNSRPSWSGFEYTQSDRLHQRFHQLRSDVGIGLSPRPIL